MLKYLCIKQSNKFNEYSSKGNGYSNKKLDKCILQQNQLMLLLHFPFKHPVHGELLFLDNSLKNLITLMILYSTEAKINICVITICVMI